MHTTISLESDPTLSEEAVALPSRAAAKTRRFVRGDSVYESILRQLNARLSTEKTPAVGITGCRSKSGATTLSAKLALQAGEQGIGRVLLIDANWESPSLQETLELIPNSGLYNVLVGDISPQDCEPEQIAENVFVISSGNIRSTSGARVEQHLAEEAIEHLRSYYDLILVDLPTANDLRSALPVAKLLDGVLLVTRSEAIERLEVQQVAQQLQRDGIELWGTILNQYREHLPAWLKKWL